MNAAEARRNMMQRKHVRRALTIAARALVLGSCGVISIFLVLSGYESVYNKTLPFVHTLDKVNLSLFTRSYDLNAAAKSGASEYGNFGKPQTLKLPSSSLRLDIVAPIQEGSSWLARASTLHLLIVRRPRAGNIGVALLYCRSSFRTLNSQNTPEFGQNMFMDTDKGWRYVYKVTSAKQYDERSPYIIADDGTQGKLVVDCNDSAHHVNTVIEATLLSVQGVQR